MILQEIGVDMENNHNTYGVVLFESAHDAIIGEKKVREHLNVALMPIPSQFSAGCGIVLRFEPEDENKMRTLLASNQIRGRIELVSGRGDDGDTEPLTKEEGDNANE
jgi:Protein of unknown function (DUF3343)